MGYQSSSNFRQYLSVLIHQLPADFDILYLGHAASGKGKGTEVKGGIFFKPKYLWQLHAYVVRGRAVDKILKCLPINAPVDNFIAQLVYDGVLVAYSLQNRLVVQEGSANLRQKNNDIVHSGKIL